MIQIKNKDRPSLASLENELKILNNLKEVNEANKQLLSLSLEDRTEREIKDRVINNLNEREKNELAFYYEELYERIYGYFKSHNAPRCPLDIYVDILKAHGIRPASFFSFVVRNDSSLYRWQKNEGEWTWFNESTNNTRIEHIKKTLEDILREKELEEKGGLFDSQNIFGNHKIDSYSKEEALEDLNRGISV